jgi:hypothetical protein
MNSIEGGDYVNRILVLLLLAAAAAQASEWKHKKETEEDKTYAIDLSRGAPEVVIKNVLGFIKVSGYSGSEVSLSIHRAAMARSPEKLEEAERDVQLRIEHDSNSVGVYLDAPYTCRDGINYRGEEYYGYRVQYDFVLRVPFRTTLVLETINRIEVDNVHGDYDVRAVEGEVSMEEVSGSGYAHSVAGDLQIIFAGNPKGDCSFGSVSGDLNLSFKEALSADFRIKTLSGEIFTDFPTEQLGPRPAASRREKGMFVYKGDRAVGVRVGSGGPEIELETISGDILIAKRKTR